MQIKQWNGMIAAQLPYEMREQVMRDIPGAKFNSLPRGDGSIAKFWTFPLSPVTSAYLIKHFGAMRIEPEIRTLAEQYENGNNSKYTLKAEPIPTLKDIIPWNHQNQAFWWGRNLTGLMLGFDMGTGKSATTVALLADADPDRVLIACPKSVIAVWPDELKRSTVDFTVLTLQKGSVKARAKEMERCLKLAALRKDRLVVVVNYDSFWREGLRETILATQWDVVVLDESHRVKTPVGKASKFAALVGSKARKRIALTGTPMPHSPLDIFAQYRAVDPGVFGTNYHRFQTRYALKGGFGGKQVIGYQNQAELTEKFKSICFQADKSLLDLPPFIHNYRTFELSPKTMAVYKRLDKELFAEIEGGTITPANAMVKVLRLQQLTGGYLKLDEGGLEQYGTEKRDALADLLEDIDKDEPVVVFARFTADIKNIKEAMENAGRTCGELSGQRNELGEWQQGGFNALAVQIRSGGVGISLVRSRYCIYYSVGHSLGDYLQSLDRTHRHGQERTVYYYHLLAEGTVDPKVYRALQSRKSVVDSIMKKEDV